MDSNYILVGRVSGAHGLKGLLQVHSYAENYEIFVEGSSLYLQKQGGLEFELYQALGFSVKKRQSLLVKIKEIQGRDQAELLKGRNIYIKKNNLPEPEEDSFYWHDLIGMDVVDSEAGSLGEVKNIMRTGSSDILEVKGLKGEILIPFLKTIIVSVSIKESLIKVTLPEGLLDL